MNLIKTIFKFEFEIEFEIESMIIYKIIFDRFDSINKECKLINHKKIHKKVRII